VYEQVAILYAGINGLLDDIAVERLAVSRGDCGNLKPASQYGELIKPKKLGDEAEKLLKEAIAEYKQTSWQQRRGKQL